MLQFYPIFPFCRCISFLYWRSIRSIWHEVRFTMCRRVITHYIHHDVRAPMVMDSVSPNPVVYANPLRTNFHTCELQLPPLEFVANTPIEKCPYHTCCIPHAYVVYCADTLAFIDEQDVEDGMEPEECEAFFLEHHHERLPYFGDECSCREVPATWRNLM